MHLFIQEMFMKYLSCSWYCLSLAMNYKGGSILAGEERQKKNPIKYGMSNDKKHYEDNQGRGRETESDRCKEMGRGCLFTEGGPEVHLWLGDIYFF